MTRTTQDIDALHRAVNQMRTMRRNLETLKAWAGGEAGGKTLVAGPRISTSTWHRSRSSSFRST